MKKFYFLLFTIALSMVSYGQTVVFQESFEMGNTGVPSETCNDGTDFFTRTDGSDLSSAYVVTGTDGSFFFAAQDTNGDPCTLATQTLIFDDIDISSFTNLTFAMLVAEDDSSNGEEDWDDVSSFIVEVDIDNTGIFTKILQFEAIELRPDGSSSSSNKEPALDTDFDGIGDGTRLSPAFQEFTAAIGNGSLIDIRLTFTDLKNGDEDIAIDNIRIVDGFTATPTISLTSPIDGSIFNPGTTSVDVAFTTANLSGGETVDISVNGSVTTGVTSPFAVPTMDGQSYNITVTLNSGMSAVDSKMTSFGIGTLTTVADITALRADVTTNGIGQFYEITGASLVTHTDGFRNRRWVEDTNISGILIYDDADVITTTYEVGDLVTGLKGTTVESNGILRFIPIEDAGVIASAGNTVEPQTVTISAFNAAPEDYESELVALENVTFVEGDGVATFETGQNYNLTDGVNTTVKRTDFFSADYIGTVIPTNQLPSVIGVAGEFNGTAQVYLRSLNDFTLSVNSFVDNADSFNVFPNPTTTGFVNITTKSNTAIEVLVFDIVGKQVISTTIDNNVLNLSNLNTGIYILKLDQNTTSITKKLVIK